MTISSLSSKPSLFVFLLLIIFLTPASGKAQQRRPAGGRPAIVVDERLSALRDTPGFSGRFLRRIGRGKWVAVRREKRTADGVVFYQVNVTRRTGGWLQRESVVLQGHARDESRLVGLIKASQDFERISRARIFLDLFPRSRWRPVVLLLFGNEAEKAACKLSRDANERLVTAEVEANGTPLASYYQNFKGLDRYRRQGVRFRFEAATKKFRYDGAAWRELVRRYPQSAEADEARKKRDLSASTNR